MTAEIKRPAIYDTSHWKVIPNFADVEEGDDTIRIMFWTEF